MDVAMEGGTCEATGTDKCGFLSSKAECDFIMMCHVGVAILSILACIYIAAVMIALKKWKNLTERLILYLTVSVFLHTFHYATDNYHNANNALNGEHIGFCIFQGMYQIFTAWLSNTWVVIIVFNISWIAKFAQRPGKHFEWISAFVVRSSCCWDQCYTTCCGCLWACRNLVLDKFTERWKVLYHWSIPTVWAIKNSSSLGGTADNLKDLYKKEIRPLLPFPWIYIVCFVPSAACRLRIAVGYDDPGSAMNFVFWLLLAVFLPLPGLLFAVAITRNYRYEMKDMFYGALKQIRPQPVQLDRPQPQQESTMTLQNLTSDLWSVVNWHSLGLLLGVPPSELRRIELDFISNSERKKSEMLYWWLRNKQASWHDIVKALHESGEHRLADTIREKYLHVADANSITQIDPEELPPLLFQQDDAEIANHIKKLKEKFNDLACDAQVELRKLPSSIKLEHCEYLKEILPDHNTALNTPQVFRYLDFYCTFIDYSLLEYVVEMFGSDKLKRKMRAHILDLAWFSKATKVSQLASGWTGRVEPPPYISEMIIKHELKPSQCTLEQLEKFRKKFCCAFRLSTFALMLANTQPGSISVAWHLPSSVVHKLISAIKSFIGSLFVEHRVLTIEIDGESVYDVFEAFRSSLQQRKTEKPRKMYFQKMGTDCIEEPHTYLHDALHLTWVNECAKLPVPMYDASAVVLGNAAYVGGGATSRNGYDNTVFKYDLQNDEWNKLPPCPVANFGLAKLAGKIVAVGGILSSSRQISNKVYTFDYEQWKEQLPPMPTSRYSLTAIEFQSNLITCGGKCMNGVSKRVEILKMGSRQWHIAHPLPSPCCNMSSAVIQDSCYLLGGYEDTYPGTGKVWYTPLLSLIEAAIPASSGLVPNTPHWCQLEQNIPSIRASAANLGDCLFAVGGVPAPDFTSLRPTPKINVYLQPSNSWYTLTNLPNPNAYFAPTVAELPNDELLIIGGATNDLTPQNTVYRGRLGRFWMYCNN